MKCAQVRELFGAYWDDEITQAERESLESHFSTCAACREEYEQYSRTLELLGSLPREEASPDLLERVLARTRRATPATDRLPVRGIVWKPLTAAAAVVVLAMATLSPWLRPVALRTEQPGAPIAKREPVRIEPRTVTGAPHVATRPARAGADAGTAVAVADSLFDHNEDIDFILDPGTVRRGHVRPGPPRTTNVQGEHAVITF